MKKLRVYLKSPSAIAVEVDGKEAYATGRHADIIGYCKRHFNVDLPTETLNFSTGTKTYIDMPKNGFTFYVE